MSDLPGGDAVHEVVAAVLAVTPRMSDGSVTVEYAKPYCGYDACTEHNDIDGPAGPIAARQAAAAIRSAADRASSTLVGDEAFRVYTWLRDLADEIDPKESRDDRH